jgi:hypothetical protein
VTTSRAPRRFVALPLVFRKGARTVRYVPRDRVHEKAIRAVMARHGWRPVVTREGRP